MQQEPRQLQSSDLTDTTVVEARQLAPFTVRGILINIRDPVDRFKSAFDWHHLRLCTKHSVRISNEGLQQHLTSLLSRNLV